MAKQLDTISEELEEEFEEIDDSDPDILRLMIAKELAEKMFEDHQPKNKQISRLTDKEIALLTIMETIDEVIGFKLYRPFAENFRVHKISQSGLSRKEIVELVKSVSTTMDSGMEENLGENRGIFSRVKRRLFG